MPDAERALSIENKFVIWKWMLPKLFTFWAGKPLGYIERLCIASILRAGHTLDVYSFDGRLEVPDGANLRNAEDVVPESRAILHKSGSWAPFADVFRYEGLLRDAGIWVDLDVLILKPLDRLGDHILGWQDGQIINNAILGLPSDSACLKQLASLCRSDVVVPPHWSRTQKMYQRVRAMVGAHTPMQDLEWGAIGPFALTHFIGDFNLFHKCQSADVFYPVPWQQAHLTFEPDASLVWNAFTSSTRAVHLWNDRIKDLKSLSPPASSFVGEMCKLHGIDT